MRILLTNDDGILAPGLEALYRAVSDFGEVDVVAPESQQSAAGHAISVRTPLVVHRVKVKDLFHGYSVDGSPADCVKLALLELLPQRPDFVLSGINAGANTSINVLYSGTVAGAVEAAFYGIPSIAFSLELSDVLDFGRASVIARALFANYAAQKPYRGMCLNVNIPALDKGWPEGVRVCPQAMVPMLDHYIKGGSPDGMSIYTLDGRMPNRDHDAPETDLAAMLDRYVSITPLRFDMTDRTALPEVERWTWPQRFE